VSLSGASRTWSCDAEDPDVVAHDGPFEGGERVSGRARSRSRWLRCRCRRCRPGRWRGARSSRTSTCSGLGSTLMMLPRTLVPPQSTMADTNGSGHAGGGEGDDGECLHDAIGADCRPWRTRCRCSWRTRCGGRRSGHRRRCTRAREVRGVAEHEVVDEGDLVGHAAPVRHAVAAAHARWCWDRAGAGRPELTSAGGAPRRRPAAPGGGRTGGHVGGRTVAERHGTHLQHVRRHAEVVEHQAGSCGRCRSTARPAHVLGQQQQVLRGHRRVGEPERHLPVGGNLQPVAGLVALGCNARCTPSGRPGGSRSPAPP
jgi:hypothetical protein